MVGSSFKDKREKVLDEKKKSPRIFISLIISALVLGGVTFWVMQKRLRMGRSLSPSIW